MATRFVYKAIEEAPFVRKVPVEFEWFGGFSLVQKRRCIASLHRAYAAGSPGDRVLEISSKSPDGLGVALSAFNLSLELGGRVVPVECAFQGSKVFEEGGPYTDLLEASPRDAKRDARLLESGRLVAFELAGERYPLEPKDAFYNFVWIRALRQHGGLAEAVSAYDAFTDIEFNPQRSINCQAIAAALYVGLVRSDRLQEALRGFGSFMKVAYGEKALRNRCQAREAAGVYEQMTERGDILAAWELLREDECSHLDVTAFKHLAFDTYWYFRRSMDYNSVLREDRPIYRDIAWVVMAADAFPETCKEYEFLCCNEFAAGLLQAIEDGFRHRYHRIALLLGLTCPGGDVDEADMSSYETYDRSFRKELILYMREQIEREESCDDDILDEQEELCAIAATKGA